MVLRNTSVAPVADTPGTGTFTIISSNPAVISYQFSTADVASTWSGFLIIKATFPGAGGGIAVYDPITWAITDD